MCRQAWLLSTLRGICSGGNRESFHGRPSLGGPRQDPKQGPQEGREDLSCLSIILFMRGLYGFFPSLTLIVGG